MGSTQLDRFDVSTQWIDSFDTPAWVKQALGPDGQGTLYKAEEF